MTCTICPGLNEPSGGRLWLKCERGKKKESVDSCEGFSSSEAEVRKKGEIP